MLELEEARGRILSAVRPLSLETVRLDQASGRVLGERLLAPLDLPGFDNSAMDGFAVRADDVAEASAEHPIDLQLIGRIAAGEAGTLALKPGCCVRLFTGSCLPNGADAVVMQEDTRSHSENPALVSILDPVKPWENIRLRGEDVKRGEPIADAGVRLQAGRISLLAACGFDAVRTARAPVVALIATGSELGMGGGPLKEGNIYESNRLALAVLAREAGARPDIRCIVPDIRGEVRKAIENAFADCDVVITSGGVSVGEFDLVKAVFQEIGGALAFWRVAIKPGKPFAFGQYREKWFFGLPGNPVAAFVTFLLLVRPALLQLQGAQETNLPRYPGILAQGLSNHGDRRQFFRVRMDGDGNVRSAGTQASHHLKSLAEANGLVDLPSRTELQAGTPVSVIRWD